MKRNQIKLLFVTLLIVSMAVMTACGGGTGGKDKGVDVDLSSLSETEAYQKLTEMLNNPDDYEGKTVKASGYFSAFVGETQNYYACYISGGEEGNSQPIEFVLKGDPAYPDGYPGEDDMITVKGVFGTYFETENKYCHLTDAELTVDKKADEETDAEKPSWQLPDEENNTDAAAN